MSPPINRYTKNITLILRPLEDNELIKAGDFFYSKDEETNFKSCFGSIGFYPGDFNDKKFWRRVEND